MLPPAEYEYFVTPWSWISALALIVLVPLIFWAISKRKEAVAKQGRLAYFLSVGVCLAFCALVLWSTVQRFFKPHLHLVVHQDFVACSSWSGIGRVPWLHITSITRARSGRFDQDVVLRFTLNPLDVYDVPWSDWVRSNLYVNCVVSDLTDDPRRFGFQTDTVEIYGQVRKAWQSSYSQARPRTYQELKKMEWKPAAR